jgi:hypothetical protein
MTGFAGSVLSTVTFVPATTEETPPAFWSSAKACWTVMAFRSLCGCVTRYAEASSNSCVESVGSSGVPSFLATTPAASTALTFCALAMLISASA